MRENMLKRRENLKRQRIENEPISGNQHLNKGEPPFKNPRLNNQQDVNTRGNSGPRRTSRWENQQDHGRDGVERKQINPGEDINTGGNSDRRQSDWTNRHRNARNVNEEPNHNRNNLDNTFGKSLFQTREDLERSPGKGIFIWSVKLQ